MRSSLPSARADADSPGIRRRTVAAIVVSLGVFALYHRTLLPGVDFGDSGSIQTMAGSSLLTPRDAYPLYFAIADTVLWLLRLEPAHGMNLVSALEGAAACGLFVLVGTEIAGSLWASVAGAILFAVSYTFWSQSVTAEVYALHMIMVLAAIYALLQWERQPTTTRLALFFALYAVGFGNHLSMILLAPGFIVFLFLAEPGGWRRMLSPRVVGMAVAIAAIGASQYLWNLRTLWILDEAPASVWSGLRTFWFDVTKSDWRDTMVLNVPRSMIVDHAAMYWFELRQQFGAPIVLPVALGFLHLAWRQPRRAWLLALLYLGNLAFAFGYNVGDAHVFYLPSHLVLALAATVGVTTFAVAGGDSRRRWINIAAAMILGGYATYRGYRDFPALDRSRDMRPTQWLNAFTAGLDEQRHIFLIDLNWQVANGLSYFTKSVAPEVLVARMRDVLLYAPALILDNQSAGRDVVVNPQAGKLLTQAYGPLFSLAPDLQVQSLSESVAGAPRGARYVLCVLKPTRDFAIDIQDLQTVIHTLTGGRDVDIPLDRYAAMAGLVGEAPSLVVAGDRPFRRTVALAELPVEIRMDSWLNADTIRRMGFGHVIARRRHALIVERGISFIALGADAGALVESYASNLFARQPRYLVHAAEARALADVLR